MADKVIGAVGNMPTPRVGAEWVPARDLPTPAPQPDASAGAPEAPTVWPGDARAEPALRSPEAKELERQSQKPPAPSGGG
jgi:hypothetical protein